MKLLRKILKWVALSLAVLLVAFYATAWIYLSNLSITTHGSVDLNFGNIAVPSERTREWANRSALLDYVVENEVKKYSENLEFGNKQVDPLIAHLAAGKDVERVNKILREAKPWGKVGSYHDYDFTLHGLTLILYSFGDQPDVLFSETVEHIVNELMTEKGGDPVVRPPWSLGLLPVKDTENHILMTESSRYLTNKWIAQRGNSDPFYDNVKNGLEAFLLGYLGGMERAGIHEYNSIPYVGYTLRPLINLASFAEGPVSDAARRVLDRMNWDYALGSLSLRRFPPFRRHPARVRETNLDSDYHTGVMKGWMSLAGVEGLAIRHGAQHAMWVGLTSYRPSDAVFDWVMSKPDEYFVQIGHGSDGSPEIYSGGPGYLISAGGVANVVLKDAVARPTTLLLEDGAMDLKEVLHVAGPGDTHRQWNNTGVHRRFAVAAGPVHVPEDWIPSLELEGWSFYERSSQRIVVHSTNDLGLFCLLPFEGELADQAMKFVVANADSSKLKGEFQWPEGSSIKYDVFADQDEWVIVSVDEKPVKRDHGRWPLMKGDVPGYGIE